MSKSYRDRRGKRINKEIRGRDCFAIAGERLITRCGGEAVGNPRGKRYAKRQISRLRRRVDAILTNALRADVGSTPQT
ncbi:hypothetical protein [Microvirga massiliensis]|uniref:hypothetical protein n=1 Tax=Microvirga massiliensis TaxID=1033741 RepID=UPI00062BB173|nr:hypothetical protein [Microvirga massiliensis]